MSANQVTWGLQYAACELPRAPGCYTMVTVK